MPRERRSEEEIIRERLQETALQLSARGPRRGRGCLGVPLKGAIRVPLKGSIRVLRHLGV